MDRPDGNAYGKVECGSLIAGQLRIDDIVERVVTEKEHGAVELFGVFKKHVVLVAVVSKTRDVTASL